MRVYAAAIVLVCGLFALSGCATYLDRTSRTEAGTTTLKIETEPSSVPVAIIFEFNDGHTTLSKCTSPCEIQVPNTIRIGFMVSPPEGYTKPESPPTIKWSCDFAAGSCALIPNPLRIVMRKKDMTGGAKTKP